MPVAPAPGTGGAAPAAPGGPLAEGSLNMTPASPTATPNQALLVSSAPARAATAANVTKLQTITAPQTPVSATGGVTIDKSSNKVENPAPTDGNATVNEATARQLLGTDFSGATKNADGSFTLDKTALARISGGATPNSSPTSTTGTPDQYDQAVAGLADKGLAAQFKTSLQTLDTQISQAQSNINSIKTRSLNDPAITGIVSSIQAKYDQAISLMKARNVQLIGKANTSVAAFGGLGVMSQDFLNNEQSQADDRIQKLQDQEDSAIARAQAAYSSQNDKDLNAAMTEYDKVNKDKMDALNNLLTASSKAVSELQTQQRLDMQQKKDDLAADVTTSTKIAAGVAANIKAAGLKDPAQISAYIKGIASQYGIQNADLLASQVTIAQAANDKADLSAANTQDQMNARDKNLQLSTDRLALEEEKVAQGPKPTLSEQKDSALSSLEEELNADNAKVPGTQIPALDSNGKLTPEAWQYVKKTAPSMKLTINDALAQIGDYMMAADGTVSPAYGLTPAQVKKIGGTSR